jgi:ketosteroid isomerase-like protein
VTTGRHDTDDAMYQAIRRVLEQSASDWSAGNLDAFMQCYEDSPETVYLSSTQVIYGYSAIHSMYAERLSGTEPLQPLKMTLLHVSRLGTKHALAVGRFTLGSGDSVASRTGVWSLVLHNTDAGWRIRADHTS